MKKRAQGISYSSIFTPDTFSVEKMWNIYAIAIFKGDVSEVQYTETKKAFYAGFLDCFKVMSDYAGELEENEACKLFDRLGRESEAFFQKMISEHGPVAYP